MRILDIILEAPTKPKLIRDGGQWKWQKANGQKLGGFSSRQEAMAWGKNNPEALGLPKPGTPEKRPRDERESGKRRADIVNKAGGEDRVKAIKALKKAYFAAPAAIGRTATFIERVAKTVHLYHFSGVKDSKLKTIRGLALATRFYQGWGYLDMYNRYTDELSTLETYRDMPEDDPDFAALKFTQDEFDYAHRLLCQEYVVEMVAMEGPVFIIWLLRAIAISKWAARIGGGVLTAITSGIGAGVGWGAVALSEALVLALQYYFSTPLGKQNAAWLVITLWDPATNRYWEPWKKMWAAATGKSYHELDSAFGPGEPSSWELRKDIKSMPTSQINAELYDLKEQLPGWFSSGSLKPDEEFKIKRRIKELEDELARRASGGSGGNAQVTPADSTEVKPTSNIPTKPSRNSGALGDLNTLDANR